MKRLISLTFLLFCFLALKAQKPQVEWSQIIETGKNVATGSVFGNAKDGYFIPRTKVNLFSGNQLMLDKFDAHLKFQFTKEMEIPSDKGKKVKTYFEDVVYMNDQLWLFSSDFDKETHTKTLYACTLDANGVINSKQREMDKITDVKGNMQGNFGIVSSSDSDKVLIYHNEPYEAKSNEKFHYKIVDASLNTVWEKSVTLPYLDKDFAIEDYDVDAKGNVVIQGSEKLHGAEAKGKADYKEVLMACTVETGQMKQFDIDLGDKYISNMYFTFGNDNNILVAGFYGNRGAEYQAGYFYTDIDMGNLKVTKKLTKEFDPKFLKDFTKKEELTNFHVRYIYESPNGNLVLTASQDYSVTTTTYTQHGSYTSTTYYSNDILAFALKTDGSIAWYVSIPKKQVSSASAMFQSIATIPVGDVIYLIYNDHPENLNVTNRKEVHTFNNLPKTSCLMMAAIQPDGKVKKQILNQPDEKGACIKTRSVTRISKNLYVALGGTLKGDDSRICTIKCE